MDFINDIQEYFSHRLPHYLELHRKMVEINSFTANPKGVNTLGAFTAQEFAKFQFLPEFVQSNNKEQGKHLFLTRHTKDHLECPTIALVSHLDTVFPEEEELQHNFHWRVEGDRLFGPGTVDIKGGTVLIYMILEALIKFTPQVFDKVNWVVCLNASEEILTDHFSLLCLERLPKNTLACLVFEGGAANDRQMQIVTSRKGRATFQVTIEGKSAHAGNYHAKGANAIVQMAHTILDIATLTDYNQKLTFNVGKVNGGVVMNRVPHYAEAEVEMRAFSPDIFNKAITDMLALSNHSRVQSRDGFTCKVNITKQKQSNPWPRNQQTDHLFNIWQNAGKKMAIDVFHEARGGLSDGNMLWQHFPTLDGLGPMGENAHCSEHDPSTGKEQEFVLASSFAPKATLNTLAILALIDHNEA
ncbi:MAG: M20/M25/M40 family metallo-hydrolase [Anaerolineales bacterium]|nr:M20/M25/M40 family metallo-hydrolase [Anaerolineales bacterium]